MNENRDVMLTLPVQRIIKYIPDFDIFNEGFTDK